MKCNTVRELFSVSFDGELSVAEEREFKSHVSSCRACSREFDVFSKSVQLVNSLSKPQVNPFFDARLKQAISDRQAVPLGERSSVFVLRPAFAFAAVAVLVSLLLLVPPGQINLNNRLSTSELAPSPEMSEVGGAPVDPLALTQRVTVPGSYDANQLSQEVETAWSARDARVASSYGSSGTTVPTGYDLANAKGAVLEVEFVLDPFFMEGTEVRRFETASAPEVEPELVSMTF